MRPFAYLRANTPPEALAGAAERGTRLLAGGTDLLREMKHRRVAPAKLVDIGRIEAWSKLRCDARGGLEAGGLVHLAEIEANPAVARLYPALQQAIAGAATPQLRNMATLAGSLLQRPSCWYYRGGFECLLAGGKDCAAKTGDNRYGGVFAVSPCVAGHPSDTAAALIALGAKVRVQAGRSTRTLPVESLYVLPTSRRKSEIALGPGEVVTAVRLAPPARGQRSVYLRVRDRATWAFALVALAASATLERGKLGSVRLVAAGVAPIPWRLAAAEALVEGQALDAELAAAAADAAVADARPTLSAAYKVEILRALVRRALLALVA